MFGVVVNVCTYDVIITCYCILCDHSNDQFDQDDNGTYEESAEGTELLHIECVIASNTIVFLYIFQ